MYSLPTELRYWRQVEAHTNCFIALRPGLYLPSLTPGGLGKYSLELFIISPVDEHHTAYRVASVNISHQPRSITGENVGELLMCVVPWLEDRPHLIPLSSPLATELKLDGATGATGSGIDHGAL